LFDALAALGLLYRDAAGRYSNSSDAAHYLVRQSPAYLGGLLIHLDRRHYRSWGLLTDGLRTGEPQTPLATGYEQFYGDAGLQELFLGGMTAGNLVAAQAIAAKFPWHAYRTFIDIGTAPGCVPIEIARAHSHLRGGGLRAGGLRPCSSREARGDDPSLHHPGRCIFEWQPNPQPTPSQSPIAITR